MTVGKKDSVCTRGRQDGECVRPGMHGVVRRATVRSQSAHERRADSEIRIGAARYATREHSVGWTEAILGIADKLSQHRSWHAPVRDLVRGGWSTTAQRAYTKTRLGRCKPFRLLDRHSGSRSRTRPASHALDGREVSTRPVASPDGRRELQCGDPSPVRANRI